MPHWPKQVSEKVRTKVIHAGSLLLQMWFTLNTIIPSCQDYFIVLEWDNKERVQERYKRWTVWLQNGLSQHDIRKEIWRLVYNNDTGLTGLTLYRIGITCSSYWNPNIFGQRKKKKVHIVKTQLPNPHFNISQYTFYPIIHL